LTQPRLHSPAIMLNLLGDLWFEKLGSDKSGSEANSLKLNPLMRLLIIKKYTNK
jgi:hypothetical protein